jgi:ethanolamine ammonia-lyase small subunit
MTGTVLPAQAAALAADPWAELRAHTPARIALGRAGTSLPTAEVQRFAAAHAQARDAVQVPLDPVAMAAALQCDGWATLVVRSRAVSREAYLKRPDWGRRLDDAGAQLLQLNAGPAVDLAIVVADGLSALAATRHAPPLLHALRNELAGTIRLAPVVIASQARVALADEVGALMQAGVVLILLGERPGLSSPDSLGAYLTHAPHLGCSDAQRNCISNIRPEGLGIGVAARRIAWLLREALRLRVSGVALKDDSETALLLPATRPAG